MLHALIITIVTLLGVGLPAQQPATQPTAVPTLTTEQQQQIQIALLVVENTDLKAQQAAQAHAQARQALQKLIATLVPEGYQLVHDPEKGLHLVKVPEKKEGGEQ